MDDPRSLEQRQAALQSSSMVESFQGANVLMFVCPVFKMGQCGYEIVNGWRQY